MVWFDNLSLRAKLFLNFVLSGGILILAILFCIVQIQRIKSNIDQLAIDNVPSLQTVAEISQLRLRYRVRSLEYMMAAPDEQARMIKSMAELDEKLVEALKRYEALAATDEQKQGIRDAVVAAEAYRSSVQAAIRLSEAGKTEEAQALRRTAWVKAANRFRDLTDGLSKLSGDAAIAASQSAQEAARQAIFGGIAALLAGVVVAFGIASLIATRVSSRLRNAVEIAGSIASGNLEGSALSTARDEIGSLLGSMQTMRDSLREAITRIRSSAETVASAADALASSSKAVRQSTDIQSESASAIAANIEQLTVSINHVADVTQAGARLANDSDVQAKTGREATEQLVGQVSRVAEVVNGAAAQIRTLATESERISQVVNVIKDIADQTNLLALNAAIEAARAGDYGRGFAVVADEVRTLSERTSKSTQEIAQTVSSIQKAIAVVVAEVEEGVELSDEGVTRASLTGEAIAQMQQIAHRVAAIVEDIDASLREQSAAATDVAQRVERISIQAEETSNASSQTSEAAERLDGIAHDMQSAVSNFKV